MKTKLSWKTSSAGIAAILGTVVTQFFPEYTQTWNHILSIVVGLGLLSARDNNVTSEQAGLK
jgi:putative Mn2+ efflux pump MntP